MSYMDPTSSKQTRRKRSGAPTKTVLSAIVAVFVVTVPGCDGLLSGDTDGGTEPPEGVDVPDGYRFVWSDEFEGEEIDTDVWTFETGGHGWGNYESQFYTDRTTGENRNAYVEDGALHIVARHERYHGSEYTSARIITQGNQSFKYGRIEARIQAPHNPETGEMDEGVWPAFWMMGDSFADIGWPYCGEIDIWESGGNDPYHVSGAVHWSTVPHPEPYEHALYDQTLEHDTPLQEDFHVYAIEWDENSIEWYIDDLHVGSFDHSPLDPNPFRDPFFLLLNVAVEGTYYFSGDADPENYPQQMIVDYVRVFQKQ